MTLPIRTTVDDVIQLCKYLATKPTGASVQDAKRVLDGKYLDGRKLAALKFWGLIQIEDGRMKVLARGREANKDAESLAKALRESVKEVEAYNAIVERAAHKHDQALSATEVAAHWHEHFKEDASDNDKILNDQAVCFFQLLEGAGLGKITIGRKGSPTRIEMLLDKVASFTGVTITDGPQPAEIEDSKQIQTGSTETSKIPSLPSVVDRQGGANKRVFISHGKNEKIVAQLKEIVTFGKFEPVVAKEHETPSKPVPYKVMDDMRACFAGIIHVSGEQVLMDDKGEKHHKINENVLIEIGGALALYKRNFILLVEKGVTLPSNLQGLYECRYEGEKLDGETTMKVLKAFNEFAE